ncbi:MAG: NmrA family NAD(P)-binding protein [Bryobacteraceae bacterium]|nr:NmrA family NAD(P)-binding protein [Bryobacteraceae bacterium]
MFVINGVNGQTGSAAANTLLERGLPVRVVVRDAAKGKTWEERGAQVVEGDLKDAASLAKAFEGATGVYVLNPPAYRDSDPMGAAEQIGRSLLEALGNASVRHVVLLSSVGAHKTGGLGMIQTNRIVEQALAGLLVPLTIVRASFFMDNWAQSLPVVKEKGILPSFSLPLDASRPLVSSQDIGRAVADELAAGGNGRKVIELQGPRDYSALDAAAAFSQVLGKPIPAVPVSEDQWPAVIKGFGFSPQVAEAYAEMLRNNNAGHFVPEDSATIRHGSVTLEQAVASWLLR